MWSLKEWLERAMFGMLWHNKHTLDVSSWQDRLISKAYVTKSQLLVPKVSTDSSRLTLAAALPSLTINTSNDKNNSTNNMERPAKSVPTKWSKQKLTLTCRRANATARFFAQFRRNKKTRKKLPREVGVISRRTNVDNGGGIFGNSRDSTSGKVVLVQEKFQFIVCMSMHKKK